MVAAFAVIVMVVVSAIDFKPMESCAQNPNVATPGETFVVEKVEIRACVRLDDADRRAVIQNIHIRAGIGHSP